MLRGKGGFLKYQHIHLHARACAQHGGDGQKEVKTVVIRKNAIAALVRTLLDGIEKLSIKNPVTEWSDYYKRTNYTKEASRDKETIVKKCFEKIGKILHAWDLGANDGRYSRLAIRHGAHVVAFDLDPMAVERNYSEVLRSRITMLPLVLDVTTPSPAIGFANRERQTIGERQKPDVIMMLAIVHHMAISNNLSFDMIAQWISEQCIHLIIEYVPKDDSQVQILLKTRDDIFPWYTEQNFLSSFLNYFELIEKFAIENSKRTIYLFKKSNPLFHP
jgi:ribosomal protein L11 methylase PrmA